MQTQPAPHRRVVPSRPSPIKIWQILFAYLLDKHYGLTLNDTPFGDEQVIAQHIDAGIPLIDALNFIVEKCDLVRTDRPGFSIRHQSPFIGHIDILRARRATGLMKRNGYKAVTDITTGKYGGVTG
ncbi:Toxin YeeV [Citrobacter youngae]|uniref:Toxin YeeV n=1 Tax=Citrobacter youngae TaxID=133448 RepID=A0ABN7GHM8_9ENTR|nr:MULTISPECIES: TA system toxin CbtA family protein [Citrobacter]EIQ7157503.1 toxin CbtA [Citrobacter sedlakii]MBU5386606.1 toxin [Citrobacter cronae]CAB5540151.1 Toxin YeeV [Citrobacter youngae]CAC9106005.1 Toxin YeeV [Citrobacter youngae]